MTGCLRLVPKFPFGNALVSKALLYLEWITDMRTMSSPQYRQAFMRNRLIELPCAVFAIFSQWMWNGCHGSPLPYLIIACRQAPILVIFIGLLILFFDKFGEKQITQVLQEERDACLPDL